MANYNETSAQGTAWKRCHKIIIDNPLGGTPSIRFFEQDVVVIGDKTIAADSSTCTSEFSADKPILMADTETLEIDPNNSVTQGDLYAILFSLYMAVAKSRDVAFSDYETLYGKNPPSMIGNQNA